MIAWPIKIAANKYSAWYERLIANAQSRAPLVGIYCETHHVIPKSWGGSNHKCNLVNLTAREHYIAHLLLWKMDVPKRQKQQMLTAFHAMAGMSYSKREYRINSRIFESYKKEFLIMCKARTGANNPNFGKRMSEENKRRLSDSNLKRYHERLATKFTGPVRPKTAFEYRGIVYVSAREAAKRVNKSTRVMKTEINYWGTCPDAETCRKIDSGELKYPSPPPINKGVPMSQEQKKLLSQTQKARLQAIRDAGGTLPNVGRKASDECRRKISEKAKNRYKKV